MRKVKLKYQHVIAIFQLLMASFEGTFKKLHHTDRHVPVTSPTYALVYKYNYLCDVLAFWKPGMGYNREGGAC